MKNPLDRFFPVEERPDGMYAKVSRTEKSSLRIEDVVAALDEAGVMNYDQTKMLDVIQRARGAFEKIGPRFEYDNSSFAQHVEIGITRLKATIKVNSSCVKENSKPTELHLVYCLRKKGIKYGIKQEIINKIVEEGLYDTVLDVAEARMPRKGENAKIEMAIAIDPDTRPRIKPDGTVDYREIKSYTSVTQGQVIAAKIPATSGMNGISVTGETLPAEPGSDVPLQHGKNTELSADGTKLVSLKTGIVYLEGKLINVAELLQINKNIDFSVGNIRYTGDVLISGNVLPGFSVEAEGNIEIQGDVESARIVSRNGTVSVAKGIIGKGDTQIVAKNGIEIEFAQEATLVTGGPIVVNKYLLHCDCTCQYLETTESQSSIIGGQIKAEEYVSSHQIGMDKGVKTAVFLIDKNRNLIKEKIRELKELENKLKAELAPIEKQLKSKAAILRRSEDDVSERQRGELKKWVDSYNTFSQKLKYVKQKIEELQQELAKPGTYEGYIRVPGITYPGVELSLFDISMNITTIMVNKKYRLVNNIIEVEENHERD